MHKIAILAIGLAFANCHHNAHSPGDKPGAGDSAQAHHSVPDAGTTAALLAIGIGATGLVYRRLRR